MWCSALCTERRDGRKGESIQPETRQRRLSVKGTDRAVLNERYRQQRHDARFTLLLGALSIAALLFYYVKQQLLLYGDAVAHINIARRVVDNRHPWESLAELGTVWLPLQHIAMLPFVWNAALWRSGIAGAIPGMVAYVLGTLGIFRLVSGRAPKLAAYVAAAIYALNPNLLYLQTTAMNEPIFLAFFIWALVYLDEFVQGCFPRDQLRANAGAKPSRTARWKPVGLRWPEERSPATTGGSSRRLLA